MSSSSLQILNSPDDQASKSVIAEPDEISKWPATSKRLPCVLYEATMSLEVASVTDGVGDLLGRDREAILSSHSFWRDCLFECDLPAIEEKLAALKSVDCVSFVHRMLNASRLPIWVSHSIVKDQGCEEPSLRGCLVPILDDRRIYSLDQTLLDRFVHKLGNHFQLLNLIMGSLKKDLPRTRDSEILLETLDKAAELTRTFAEANQVTSWMPEVEIAEVLKGVLESHRSLVLEKGVLLGERIDEELSRAKLSGDPFLLEAALSHIFMEVLDAAHNGEAISVTSTVAQLSASAGVAKLRFQLDRGLNNCDRSDANAKKNHDGMAIPLAARFVEMHGGLLSTERVPSGIKMVEVSLPVALLSGNGCA